MLYEYGWMDPKSGLVWADGYQPVMPGLVFVKRPTGGWEPAES